MTPAGMLRHLNSTLFLKTDKRLFVAMLLASFESGLRNMTFANAGQALPVRRRGGALKTLTGKGERFPLGLREYTNYEDCTVDLQPGDILVFTTDGVAEARRSDGTVFGDSELNRVIPGLPMEVCAREMVQMIIAALQGFTGGQNPHDDVTIVVVKVE
jgi:serine phosphatase RsbU (regulator of sigma subunit)